MHNKAFISYSHSSDTRLAPALQSALERFAKPWYRQRAFRVFRDTTNLSLAPELWPEIEKALSQSEYLLFLASPEAANSKWVNKELTYWLKNKDTLKLFIILTRGVIAWDDINNDFDWNRTTSVPDDLSKAFSHEPLYLDFSGLSAGSLSLDNEIFLDHVATIAAPLHNKSKDEIFGEHILQHRKTMRLAYSAVTILTILVMVTVRLYSVAERRREQAEHEARIATAQRLGAQSRLVLSEFPERSLLLAAEALRLTERESEPRVPAAEEALRQALAVVGGRGLGRHPGDRGPAGVPRAPASVGSDCPISPLGGLGYRLGSYGSVGAISPGTRFRLTVGKYESDRLLATSPEGRWLLTLGDDSTARLWNLAENHGAAPIILHDDEPILSASFTPDGHWLITGGWNWDIEDEDQNIEKAILNPYKCRKEKGQITVRLWDLTAKDPSTSQVVLRGHKGAVDALAVDPRGRWLVTGSWDKTARIWDLKAKDPSISSIILHGHQGKVHAASFTNNGSHIITGSADGTAMVWDLTAPDPAASPIILRGHEGEVSLVAATSDGHKVVTAGRGTTPRLWNLAAKEPSVSPLILNKIETTIEWVRLSPDGRWLVTGGQSAYASLTDLNAPDPSSSYMILSSSGGPIRKVAFSPDGHWLVSTTGYSEELAEAVTPEHTVRLWDLTAGDPSASPIELNGHDGVVFDADFDANSEWLATGSGDGTVRLWKLEAKGQPAFPIVLKGYEDAVYRVAFSPDDRWLISASLDGSARLWDLGGKRSWASPPSVSPIRLSGLNDSDTALGSVTLSNDGRRLFFSGPFTGKLSQAWHLDALRGKLWDIESGDGALPLRLPLVPPGNNAVLSRDGRWLAQYEVNSSIMLWNLKNVEVGQSEETATHISVPGSVERIEFGAGDRWLIVGFRSKSDPSRRDVQLFDLAAANPLTSAISLSTHTGQVNTLAGLSHNGRWLVTGDNDKTARLWDLTTDDPLSAAIILQDEDKVVGAAFSPGDRWLATGDWGNPGGQKTIRLWDLTAKDPAASRVALVGHSGPIWDLQFSANGQWLATGAFDAVQLWDLARPPSSASPVKIPIQAGVSLRVKFSPDGHWLVTSSFGSPPQLWDLRRRNSSPSPSALLGHQYPFILTAISLDSHWLVTADTDLDPPSQPGQTCRIWDLTAQAPATSAVILPMQECRADLITISPSGRWLITAGSHSGVRLWPLSIPTLIDLAQRAAGRELTAEERGEYVPFLPESKKP